VSANLGLAEPREDGPLPRAAVCRPGLLLDDEPWAASWGEFMRAVMDRHDNSARQAIAEVMTRLQNAGLTERIPSEGGFLVPERLRTEVLSYMTGAIIRPRATYVPMDSLRVPIPLLDNPTQASGAQALGGMTFSLVEEGATIPATVPTFGVEALEARKVAGYLASVPNELIADATPFTDVFLPRTIGQGLSWYEEDLWINGTGVGEPMGLISAPGAVQQDRTTSDAVVMADLVNCIKALHPQAERGNAVWLLSDTVFSQLLDMYLNVNSATSGLVPPPEWLTFSETLNCWRLLGIPAFPTDHQPALGSTGDVILGDLSLYLIGDRGMMTVEVSAKGPGFGSDTSNVRVRHRIDGRYWIQSPITTEQDQVVSPLVVLNAAT
jgi:predicted phage gp36 major capsid-like protein